MSDYISKSAVTEMLMDAEWNEGTFTEAILKLSDIPTLSETEIIRKAFERVVERLEERRSINDCRKCRHFTKNGDECNEDCTDALVDDLIEIVKEEGGIE